MDLGAELRNTVQTRCGVAFVVNEALRPSSRADNAAAAGMEAFARAYMPGDSQSHICLRALAELLAFLEWER